MTESFDPATESSESVGESFEPVGESAAPDNKSAALDGKSAATADQSAATDKSAATDNKSPAAAQKNVTKLSVLAYHESIADELRREAPQSWDSFSAADVAEFKSELLRAAYRMEPDSHPDVYGAARSAASALGIESPISVWQLEGSAGPNASLVYAPDEVIIAFAGNLLDQLAPNELVAVFGHEMAHHVLWSIDSHRYLVADRLLDAYCLDAGTPAAYLETARRYSLATELFADRGAYVACADLHAAVAALVKTVTGLANVDAAAYLRQAAEVAAAGGPGTDQASHPENVRRCWALADFAGASADASASADGSVAEGSAAEAIISGSLDIDRLDLIDQVKLRDLTRKVIETLLVGELQTETTEGHARTFFPDFEFAEPATKLAETETTKANTPNIKTAKTNTTKNPYGATDFDDDAQVESPPRSEATDRYLAYVLLDFATVDPELDDEPICRAIAVAQDLAIEPVFQATVIKELALSVREYRRLEKRAPAQVGTTPLTSATAEGEA